MYHLGCDNKECSHEWDTTASATSVFTELCDWCGSHSHVLSEFNWNLSTVIKKFIEWPKSSSK